MRTVRRMVYFTHERRGSRFGLRIGRKTVMVTYTHYRILQYLAITRHCYPNLKYVSLEPITLRVAMETFRLRWCLRKYKIKRAILLTDGHGKWMLTKDRCDYVLCPKAWQELDEDLLRYHSEAPYPEKLVIDG